MENKYILINEENRQYFERVFPKDTELTMQRVAIGAVDDENRVVGAVSYFLAEYEYQIDWIYVEPTLRRNGIGRGLVKKVIDVVMGTGDLFPVTAMFESGEESILHSFFLTIDDMVISYSHDRYHLTSRDIKNSAELRHAAKAEIVTENFFDRPEKEQKNIILSMQKDQPLEIINFDQWKEHCVPQLCKCVFVKNNLVDLIFMQKSSDGNLELSYLYGKYPKGLFKLLADTVEEYEKLFPNADLTFEAVSDDAIRLAGHLFPNAKCDHIYEAVYC